MIYNWNQFTIKTGRTIDRVAPTAAGYAGGVKDNVGIWTDGAPAVECPSLGEYTISTSTLGASGTNEVCNNWTTDTSGYDTDHPESLLMQTILEIPADPAVT